MPKIQSIESLMLFSLVVPVALLSIFPHQEPRFVIPVVLPIVFLFAHELIDPLDVNTIDVAQEPRDEQFFSNVAQRNTTGNKSTLKTIWFVGNVILLIFYGFLHQGGVLPLTSHISKELKSKQSSSQIHLVTTHSYPIPTGLLHLRNTRKTYTSDSGHKYVLAKDFFHYELGSKDVGFIRDKIKQILNKCEEDWRVKRIPYRLYYALPMSFYDEFAENYNSELVNSTEINQNFNFYPIKQFYPHLSVEKLPKLHFVFSIDNLADEVINYFTQCSLLLLKIELSHEKS